VIILPSSGLLPVFSLEPLDYLPLICYHGKPVKLRVWYLTVFVQIFCDFHLY